MDSFWVKTAIFVCVIGGLFFVVKKYFVPAVMEVEDARSITDVWREDDKRLRAEPKQQPTVNRESEQTEKTAEQVQPAPAFRQLDEIEMVDAERLFEIAIQHRKMGRMGGIGFKQMVDYCRQIIGKYPDSLYAYKARRLLGEVPRRFWERYGITEQEVNIER